MCTNLFYYFPCNILAPACHEDLRLVPLVIVLPHLRATAAMGDMTAAGEVVPPPMEAPSLTAVEADTVPFYFYTGELLRTERNVEMSGAQSKELYKLLSDSNDKIEQLHSQLKDEEEKREL